MKQFLQFLVVFSFFLVGAPLRGAQGVVQVNELATNAPEQQDKPYVVLVSIDGMRWDFPDLFPTPSIRQLIVDGTRAERLLPVWPTLTFPNHFTLVTGLLPHRHGLVANEFRDPELDTWYRTRDRHTVQDERYYLGEPIWVTAARQGMVTASFYWVGSEAPVLGRRPDRWLLFDKNVPGEARVDQVLEWLQLPTGSRPHLVTLYFEFLDDRAHWNGIGSTEFLATMDRVDALIGRLRAGIATLPHGAQVNVVVVSDHGQMPYLDEPPFILDRHVDLTGLTLVEGGPYVLAWQERPDPVAANELAEQVNRSWPHGRAFTRASAPAEWHLPDSPRNPQLVFVADAGYAVLSNESMKGKVTPGDHGWAPDVPQMDGVFMATGPGIRRGAHIGPVESTDVHALLLSLLQLDPPQIKTDGGDAALQVLRREP